jgi:hypothetical protein
VKIFPGSDLFYVAASVSSSNKPLFFNQLFII